MRAAIPSRMALNWEAAKQAILNAHTGAQDAGNEIRLSLSFGGAHVSVRILAGAAGEQPGMLLVADICGKDQLEPSLALAHNMTLAVGALAVAGDALVLRHILAFADALADSIERVIRLLAHEAARLRVWLSGRVRAGDVFAAYAA